jgi:PST family polysaccharide transporter
MATYFNLKNKFVNNGKVVENYFFMTALQLLSSAFGILIYPYLIRTLGGEVYGIYVFAFAVISYFVVFISFGFSLPGLKYISQNKTDVVYKSNVVSCIVSSKIYLALVSLIVFVPVVFFVPFLNSNKLIFTVVYLQIIAEVIFPAWYFQGVQKMKIVTYFQLFFRIASLPFIFILIKSPTDIQLYTWIATLSVVFPAIGLFLYLIYIEKLKITLRPISELKPYFADAMPFFWSSMAGTLKQESVTVIIGGFFGMRDVALYDLANKLILMPRMLTASINAALFPKVIDQMNVNSIKKIIRYEWFIGVAVMALTLIFGYWVIWFLGGPKMIDAYPLAVILSFTVLSWLVVGSYINFIFIPLNKYFYVTRNQIVALLSFLVFSLVGLFFYRDILVLVVALSLSGLSEMLYCRFLIAKHKLL